MRFDVSCSRLGVLALAALLVSAPAWAVAPVSKPIQQGPVPAGLDLVPIESSYFTKDPRWLDFQQTYGGTWWGPVNAYTGVPYMILGSGIQVLPADDANVPPAEVEAVARSFFQANEPLFGFGDVDNLVATFVFRTENDTWRIWFDQLHQGLPIRHGYLKMAIKRGRIIQFGGQSYPNISLSTVPSVTEGQAIGIVTSQLAGLVGMDESDLVETQLVVYPEVSRGSMAYHLAWKVTVRGSARDTQKNVVTFLDARTGDVLQQFDAVAHYNGTASIEHDERSVSQNNLVVDPSTYLRILIGGSANCSDYPSGSYNIGGSGTATLEASLNHPASCARVRVFNQGGSDVVYTTTTSGTKNFTINQGDEASRDCHYFIPQFKEYVRPVYSVGWLDNNLICNVNVNGTCNAYWNGVAINFFPAGGGCNSTGRISDVIFHEYGHGMDQNGPGGTQENAYGEFYGDQNSLYYWDDCTLGLGFYSGSPNSGLRNLCNDRMYPSKYNSCGSNYYCKANVLGSTTWDAWENVKAYPASGTSTSKRQMIFMEATINAQRVGPEWYGDFLTADDDDGNLANSTPNACVVWDAFDAHGDSGAQSWGSPVPNTRPACNGTHGGGGGTTGAELITGPGPNPNSSALVTEWQHDYSTKVVEFAAYGSTFGTNVSGGNVNGGALSEVVTGAGPSAVNGPQVKAFQAASSSLVSPAVNYYAYGTLKYGVKVATGDVDADSFAEIITGAGPGAVFGPHVRGWNYDGSTLRRINGINFFAYQTLKWGVVVSTGRIRGAGAAEILTGSGPSGAFGPQVRAFRYTGSAITSVGNVNFFAWANSRYGCRVAGGNYDNDAYDEIVVGKGPSTGNGTEFKGFNYDNNSVSNTLTATGFAGAVGGAVVASGDLDDGSPGDEIVVSYGGRGTAAPAAVRGFKYNGAGGATQSGPDFNAYSGSTYGVTLAIVEIGAY